MPGLPELISHLDTNRHIVIQAHDFPDHDAVAAAFGLARLLSQKGLTSTLCYGGEIQSDSLVEAVRVLEIPIATAVGLELEDDAQIVIVDGFVGNKNMSGIPGEVVGVIDHHSPPRQPDCKFFDIRENYGSCSTIIFDYYREAGAEMDPSVATALLMGIMMDTAFMTRGVSKLDLEAFSTLFFKGDWETGSRLLKNSLSLRDLGVFREAINSCIVAEGFCFVPIQKECSAEVMALVADFFLGLREIHFVVVVEPDRDAYRLSVRSEDHRYPSDVVVREALNGIGSGGGHIHMGGGAIPTDLYPGEEGLRRRFLSALGIE
ncbi:MAG: exopolyphosphatase [Spirochaetaceae bacterium]|nr:MAG: exopolyphosphatase [Spirochaetaceae bacterium]